MRKNLDYLAKVIKKVSFNYEDNYSAGEALAKYKSSSSTFIHFTDHDKLEINDNPSHYDPKGIYFYPTRWLWNNASWGLYALNRNRYFVAKISTSNPGIIKLKGFNRDDALNIAHRNGWIEYLRKMMGSPDKYARSGYPRSLFKGSTEHAAYFYATMDALVNSNNFGTKMTWEKLLKGIKGIYDNTNKGVIAAGEPSQIVIFDPAMIKIIEEGENYHLGDRKKDQAIREITQEFGGEFKDDHSVFDFEGAPVKINWDNFTIEYYNSGILVDGKIRLGFEVWDRGVEGIKDSLRFKIKDFIDKNKPTPEGEPLRYNKDFLVDLAKRLNTGSDWYPYYKVDGQSLSYNGSFKNFFGSYNFELSSGRNGHLVIELNAYPDTEISDIENGELVEVPVNKPLKFGLRFMNGESLDEVVSKTKSKYLKAVKSLGYSDDIDEFRLTSKYMFAISGSRFRKKTK